MNAALQGAQARVPLQYGLLLLACYVAPVASAVERASEAELTNKTGTVTYRPRDQTNEIDRINPPLPLFARDMIRTRENSTAVVWLNRKNCSVRLGQLSTLEILPPVEDSSPWLNLVQGALYLFSRDRTREVRIKTRHATGAPRGTEFALIVEPDRTLLAMYDGTATLTNELGGVELGRGEVGVAIAGKKPTKTRIEAENIVQWWLYYPGVLDVDELEFTPSETNLLASSLDAYRSGDLATALASYPGYPSPAQPTSDAGRIYLAGLSLSAGEVEKAETLLRQVTAHSSLAASLRWVIAAVQQKVDRPPEVHTSASEWLGLSYYFQARHELEKALDAAQRSVVTSTNFAFGWERVAELQFSFGRIREAKAALERSLQLAPRNAQAHALKGFLLSAENHWKDARESFEEAIRLDSSLGNGWLGRGLVRIRKGDAAGGRADLQMAAILEPNRSLLHSYLGKAFSDAGQDDLAALELKHAEFLDPNDPTPWLYSALLKREQNEINAAVNDLEQSIQLNTNRAVYRSQFLLDEDRAVRSSSLANVYQSAGMREVSVREAARAVSYDYANYSAHQFLSESFNALRDPTRFNLRHETVWFNELLLANLLSPVGGTALSQHVSQQEYSRLFERDRVGLASSSEYRSDGQFHELASQYGTIGNTGWSLDLDYRHNDGIRRNNDLDSIEWYTTIKQQLTPQDSLLLLTKYQDYHSGDNFQYFYRTNARPNFRFDEYQQPIAVLGYHHEWQPGVHTLLLGGRLENDQRFTDTDTRQLILWTNAAGDVTRVDSLPMDVRYRSEFEIYTAELNQIFEGARFNLIFGGRFQTGSFNTRDRLTLSSSVNTNLVPFFGNPPAAGSDDDDFERLSGYAYYTLEPIEHLVLTAGLTYDRVTFPENFRSPPVAEGSETRDRLNPKAALVWSPLPELTLRGVFTRALGGVSFDESFRLEPTQLAGFGQAFRSVISESLVGSVAAPTYDIVAAALDLKLKPRTYFGIEGHLLDSEVGQEIGVFNYNGMSPMPSTPPPVQPGSIPKRLDYEEQSVAVTLNQLVADEWSFGAQYRFTRAELGTTFPSISTTVSPDARRSETAELHQTTLFAQFNHRCGFFARADGEWNQQENSDYPSADFYQLNATIGYRFPRQRGEVSVGVLNINDTNYRLNPLTPYQELPRERVFVGWLSFRF